jgi:purine-binding chemotaxis protein CheW
VLSAFVPAVLRASDRTNAHFWEQKLTTTAIQQTGAKAGSVTKADKYLSFYLGKEEFAISVSSVREIIGIQEITHVPQMPIYVEGVLNLRGKVIPVINMRRKCGLPDTEQGPQACIVVVQIQGDNATIPMGVVVDGVSEVANVPSSDIEDMPEFGGGDAHQYLIGVAKQKGRVKILIDINLLLNTREVLSLQAAV